MIGEKCSRRSLAKRKRRLKRANQARRNAAKRGLLLLMVPYASCCTPVLGDLPTGGSVIAGQAAISQVGATLDVNASTTRSIINWDSFNLGAGKTANFNLPNVNSAVLNRVTTPRMPSTIAGTLNSNGNVMLVNPSGIMVNSSRMVNTNGFTASTFDIANDQFMAGGALKFRDNGSQAAVVNHGTIIKRAGGAHLIANDIANSGVISSSGGNVTMSGGGSVTLENGVTYMQPSMQTLASGISSTAGLIQNSGTVRATGAATSGGEVYLVNPNGNILHDGTIAAQKVLASGKTTGGQVQLEANQITLQVNSSIDASGTNGGGEVLVGGDWQGGGVMTHATTVTMEAGSAIDASAIRSGDGGEVVLWSDVNDAGSLTEVHGDVIARGGTEGGDGGRIETSGHQVDTSGIEVDAGATKGGGGLWLIDPYNYAIDATAAGNIVSSLNTGTSVTVTTTANNAAHGSSGNSADIGDITITGDIITGAMSGDATLTLQAARHIGVEGSVGIDATQNGNVAKLNVKLWADTDDSGDGINIISAPSVKTNGGTFTVGNGNTASIGGATVKVGGDIYINGTVAQLIDTAGGDIAINGETIVANSSVSGITFDSGGGDIVFGGLLNSGNHYTYVDGPDGQANSWNWARTDAKNGTAAGSALGDSYLVTITSRLENAIAGIAADYRGAWIGAFRLNPASSYDWQWADGPEAGQSFFTQSAGGGGSSQSGWYSNFGSGEPNGTLDANSESVGQFFGDEGLWNDLSASTTFLGNQASEYSVLGYVRETNLSPTAVTIDAGTTGTVSIGGVGSGKALATLNVTSAGVVINGDALITTGAQTYNSSVNLTSLDNVLVDGTTITLSGAGDDLLLKAAQNIDVAAATTLQTNNGDITLWSDSDANSDGHILIGNNVTFNSANGLTNQLSGGGAITLGGGSDGGSDDRPDGFAFSTTVDGIKLGTDGSNSSSIYSGGGNVSLKGQTSTTSTGGAYYGVGSFGALTVDSGEGTIGIAGESADDYGVAFSTDLISGTGLSLTSTATSGIAIAISGTTTGTSSYGVVFNNASEKLVQATGGGDVQIAGTGTGSLYGVYTSNTNVLASTGDIVVDGGVQGINSGGSTFGQKAGTAVTSATGDVTLTGDVLNWFGTDAVDTTGLLAVQPASDSFSSALIMPATFTISNISALTLGRATNTADITVSSAQNVNGAIIVYGGLLTLDGNLTSTATAGTGIQLRGTGITHNAGVEVSTAGADIEYLAANAAFTSGGDHPIQFEGTSGSLAVIDAAGGDVSISSSFATTGTAGNSDRAITMNWSEVKTYDSGSITIVGDATNDTNTGNTWGFQGYDSLIQTDSGAIDITTTGGKASGNSRGFAIDGSAFKILSESGAITIRDLAPIGLTGSHTGLYLRPDASTEISVGADGSTVAASTSDILIQSDRVAFAVNNGHGTTFNTSGDVVVESTTDSFAAAPSLSGLTMAGAPASLRIGKSTNTTNISLGSSQSVGGPVSVYGNNITVNANIDTTAGAADGDVLLKATGHITQSAGIDITSAGGDVTFWTDSDSSGSGYIELDTAASVITGGGDIVMGGGADADTNGIPDGAAIGQIQWGAYYSGISLYLATLDAQAGGSLGATAGNISINGTGTYSGANRAVGCCCMEPS